MDIVDVGCRGNFWINFFRQNIKRIPIKSSLEIKKQNLFSLKFQILVIWNIFLSKLNPNYENFPATSIQKNQSQHVQSKKCVQHFSSNEFFEKQKKVTK